MAEKDRIRTKKLQVFMTENELQYTKYKAKYCNMTMSEYIRKMIKDGIIIKLDTGDVKGLANELNKIGTNINQIARYVNETKGQHIERAMESIIVEFGEMQQAIYDRIYGVR